MAATGNHGIADKALAGLFDGNLLEEAKKLEPGSVERFTTELRHYARQIMKQHPDMKKAAEPLIVNMNAFRYISRTPINLPAWLIPDEFKLTIPIHLKRARRDDDNEDYEISKVAKNDAKDCVRKAKAKDINKKVYGSGELLRLPVELLTKIVTDIDSIGDLNNLSQTCRMMRILIEPLNLKPWIPHSYNEPLCGPYPHAVVGATARALADWVVEGKGECVDGSLRTVNQPCVWDEHARIVAFHNSMEEDGTFGLMYLAITKVGVRLNDLRKFHRNFKAAKNILDFDFNEHVVGHMLQDMGTRKIIIKQGRHVAVANKIIYSELFHHEVDNLCATDWLRTNTLGQLAREAWLNFCVPDENGGQPIRCILQHKGIDRLMLQSMLDSIHYERWSSGIESVWSSRILERPFARHFIGRTLNFYSITLRRLKLITENTVEYGLPTVPMTIMDQYPNMEFLLSNQPNEALFDKIVMDIAAERNSQPTDHEYKRSLKCWGFMGLKHDMIVAAMP